MVRNAGEFTVTLSVLERLIDEEPEFNSEAPMTRAQSLRRLKAGVRRDLEWLLNTRCAIQLDDSFARLGLSVYCYGLPDFTAYSLASSADQTRLLRNLYAAVKAFEPRLTNVKVVPSEVVEEGTHRLRFRIDGLLLVDPAPEHVSFDTVLELTSGEYQVRDGSDA